MKDIIESKVLDEEEKLIELNKNNSSSSITQNDEITIDLIKIPV